MSRLLLPFSLLRRPNRPHPGRRLLAEEGAATAEYAVVIMAAVGFASLLVVVLKSGAVQGMLTDLVQRALSAAG